MASAATETEIKGYPHVSDIAVGDAVEAKIDDAWVPGTLTWVGDLVVYVRTADQRRHKVNRFASTLRVPGRA